MKDESRFFCQIKAREKTVDQHVKSTEQKVVNYKFDEWRIAF